MKFTKEIVEAIKKYIVDNVSKHPNDVLALTSQYFKITKPTANKYLNELIEDNILRRTKNGRYPEYKFFETKIEKTYDNDGTLEEDKIWRNDFSPYIKDVPHNVRQACQYGFTEMVNNAIDHSESIEIGIRLITTAISIQFHIQDFGIGIFNKIQRDMQLDDPKQSILELAKGKFTSDPKRHSGEGIFFTSRIFDMFVIFSKNLAFHGHRDNDWILDSPGRNIEGTVVVMEIAKHSLVNIVDIFNEFTDPDSTPGFHKTIVPVQLMQYEGEELISRSQAKRLINRFDRFLEVILDFTGVSIIGQAFADEVFRVFKSDHPGVHVIPVNYNENIKTMIEHVTGKKGGI